MFKEYLTTQEVSNSITLNKIGDMAKSKGYEVTFFYDERVKANFVHILKNEKLFISIYFDKFSKLAFNMPPYFELYDLDTTYRYLLKEKDLLIEKVKEYL